MTSSGSTIQLYLDPGAKATVTNALGSKREGRSGDEISSGYRVASDDSTGVTLSFPGGLSARLAPTTQVILLSDDSLLLEKGEVWVSSIGSTATLTVYVPQGAMATSDHNSFNVASRDGSLSIFAARNPVRTALFLPKSSTSTTLFSPADIRPLNSILVTEGSQLDVLLSKIQPKLEKLLYSKLVKEFQYQPVLESEIKKNTWFQFNYQLDASYRDTALAQLIAMVKSHGTLNPDPSNPLAMAYRGFHAFRNALTFDQRMRRENVLENTLSYLDDAIYLSTVSQNVAARDRMNYFTQLVANNAQDQDFLRSVEEALWDRLQRFSLVVPQDGSLFALKIDLRNALLSLNYSGYKLSFDRASRLVRSGLYDVSSALNFDTAVTNQLFHDYVDGVEKLFVAYADDIAKSSQVLAEENQLLAQLYLRSPLFYNQSYFSQKFKIESEWLKLLPDDTNKQEENQTLIAAKIDLMKKLRSYFFQDKVQLIDARAVMYMLLTDITQATDTSSDTAAVQHMRDALKLQQSFWKYLNSSEFADSSVHGQTHRDRFLAFEKNVIEQKEIESIQEGLLGTIPLSSSESRQTLLDVQKSFTKMGVTKLEVSPLLDKDQKQVYITSAEYQGVPFSAIYDRDSSLISDVKVYGETVLSSAVPLNQLKTLFRPKSDDDTSSLALASDVGSIGASSLSGSFNENSVEKVARLFIVKKFSDLGFTLSLDQVETVNYQTKLFRLAGVELPFDSNPIILTFSLDLKSNMVSDVSFPLLGQPVKMTGEFALDAFAEQVKVYYEKTFYEKVEGDLGMEKKTEELTF